MVYENKKDESWNVFVYYFYVCIWAFAYMYVEDRRGCPSLGTRGQDDCKLPRGCWETNSGSLQEQQWWITASLSLNSWAVSIPKAKWLLI